MSEAAVSAEAMPRGLTAEASHPAARGSKSLIPKRDGEQPLAAFTPWNPLSSNVHGEFSFLQEAPYD